METRSCETSAVDVFGYLSGGGGLGNSQLLGNPYGSAPAAVRIPDNFTLIGIHSLRQGAGLGLKDGGAWLAYSGGRAVTSIMGSCTVMTLQLDQILQLTDIARPVVLLQKTQKLRRKVQILAVFPAESGQELVSQRENIFLAQPQGRNVNPDDIEPVKKIGAKQAALHFFLQIAVGSDNQPEIQRNPPAVGKTLNGFFLNQLQQLGLNMRGSSPISSKNKVPWLASSILPIFLPEVPGSGVLLVAEELGLHQIFVEHCAVDFDKGTGCPVAHGMNGFGDGGLAHAGLACNEDIGFGVGRILHQGPKSLHGAAFEDQAGGSGRVRSSAISWVYC